MRKVLAGTLLVVALAFSLAGCGGSGSSTTTTEPKHSSNGEASKSANQVLADAVKAADSATHMRINGTVNASGQQITLDLSISKGEGAKGIITLDKKPVGLIVIGKDGYIKADKAFWEEFGGSNGAMIAQLLEGRWLKFPVDNKEFEPLVAFSSPNALFDQLKSGADKELKNNGVTTYKGQSVVALDDGKEGTLYVAASGNPYPVALVKTGSDGGTINFGAWNHPFALTAPSDALDFSHIGG